MIDHTRTQFGGSREFQYIFSHHREINEFGLYGKRTTLGKVMYWRFIFPDPELLFKGRNFILHVRSYGFRSAEKK